MERFQHCINVHIYLWINEVVLHEMLPNSLMASTSSSATCHGIFVCSVPGSPDLPSDVSNASALLLRLPSESSLSTSKTSLSATVVQATSSSCRLVSQIFMVTVAIATLIDPVAVGTADDAYLCTRPTSLCCLGVSGEVRVVSTSNYPGRA